jgi:hypothetical protein
MIDGCGKRFPKESVCLNVPLCALQTIAGGRIPRSLSRIPALEYEEPLYAQVCPARTTQ